MIDCDCVKFLPQMKRPEQVLHMKEPEVWKAKERAEELN